jgi:cytochrome b pre-mRNA-processing protein 3
VKSYHAAFAALPEPGSLQDLLARTVYADGDAARAPALAAYVTAQRAQLAANPLDRLLAGHVDWRMP